MATDTGKGRTGVKGVYYDIRKKNSNKPWEVRLPNGTMIRFPNKREAADFVTNQ